MSHSRHAALLAAVLSLASPAAAQEVAGIAPGRVIDGDTFQLSVRVLGLDAPEQGARARCPAEAALAERATARSTELLRGRVTLRIAGHDRYGRLLAEVTLDDGRDLAAVLIEEGLARPWRGRRSWCR